MTLNRFSIFLLKRQGLVLLTLSGLTGFAQSTTPEIIPPEIQQVARKVRPEAIEAHMRYLSDDKLAGRKPGSPGYELAAQYVEGQFKALGFKPQGQRGTFRQAVPLRKAQVREEAS